MMLDKISYGPKNAVEMHMYRVITMIIWKDRKKSANVDPNPSWIDL